MDVGAELHCATAGAVPHGRLCRTRAPTQSIPFTPDVGTTANTDWARQPELSTLSMRHRATRRHQNFRFLRPTFLRPGVGAAASGVAGGWVRRICVAGLEVCD